MIKEAHDELLDIQSSGRSKELLAQVRGRGRVDGEDQWDALCCIMIPFCVLQI